MPEQLDLPAVPREVLVHVIERPPEVVLALAPVVALPDDFRK